MVSRLRSIATRALNEAIALIEKARAGRAPEARARVRGELSIVLSSYARPRNVERIAARYLGYACVSELIVWHQGDGPAPRIPRHPKLRTIAGDDLGLSARVAAALLASSDAVILHDDDLLCDEATLAALLAHHVADPERTYALHGKDPGPDGRYGRPVRANGAPRECEVHLTRVACVPRRHLPAYFRALDEIGASLDPRSGGGEDILLSYVVRAATGKRPQIVPGRWEELPAPRGISNRSGSQMENRDAVMKACQAWLARQPSARS